MVAATRRTLVNAIGGTRAGLPRLVFGRVTLYKRMVYALLTCNHSPVSTMACNKQPSQAKPSQANLPQELSLCP